jgi:hypothetical protein
MFETQKNTLTNTSCLLDVIIGDSEADFHLELKQEILTRSRSLQKGSNENRPVMVFFRSKEALTSFFESTMMKQLKDVTNICSKYMYINSLIVVHNKFIHLNCVLPDTTSDNMCTLDAQAKSRHFIISSSIMQYI